MTRPDALAPFRDHPDRCAVLVDFDGSLAPIVDDPAAAAPLPGAVHALSRLVGRYGRVGVISGRPVEFLRNRLPIDGLELAGVYGLERLVSDEVVVDPRVERHGEALERAAAEARTALPGVVLERKGLVSFVLHWRTVPEEEEHALATGRALAQRFGLVAEQGRRSLEIRPPVPLDKGVATEVLARGMEGALFAGDDRGDLAAFDALDAMVSDGRLRHGVKIAVTSPEAPPELLERADERVGGPEELLALLEGLV